MVSKVDRETYKALVYSLCDQYMIAANPDTLTVKVNIDSKKYKFSEIQIATLGFHVQVYNRYHKLSKHAFLRNLSLLLNFLSGLS